MTTAYWCVLFIILLAYIWGLMARLPGLTPELNLTPRINSENFTGLKQRIYWSHLNALEAIAPFSAAIIIAHLAGVQQATIDNLALAFVALRIAHAVFYMANLGIMRTLVFIAGMGCIITLFIKSA